MQPIRFNYYQVDEHGRIAYIAKHSHWLSGLVYQWWAIAPTGARDRETMYPLTVLGFADDGDTRHRLACAVCALAEHAVPPCEGPFDAAAGEYLNPYNPGGAADFVRRVAEFPRYESQLGGTIFFGGREYIQPEEYDESKMDFTPEWEQWTTCGFDGRVAAFRQYVQWAGRNAHCGGAAFDAVAAFDRLVAALHECGIDRFGEIVEKSGQVEAALATLCREIAVADSQGAPPPVELPDDTRAEIEEMNAAVQELKSKKDKLRENGRRGGLAAQAERRKNPEVRQYSADVETALMRVYRRVHTKGEKVEPACRFVINNFTPQGRKNPVTGLPLYYPLKNNKGETFKAKTLARYYRDEYGTKRDKGKV